MGVAGSVRSGRAYSRVVPTAAPPKPAHTRGPSKGSNLEPKEPDEQACNGRKADGSGYCRAAPGWGTAHAGIGRCKRHGGSTPLYAQKVEKLRAAAYVEQYGLPRHIDPFQALEEELDRSAGHVDFLRLQVAALETEAMHGPVGGGQGAIPEHKPHVWIGMYNEERDRFRRIAKTCIDAGLSQRRVEVAEAQGQLLAAAVRGILDRLGVLNHPEAATVVREELLRLSAAPTEVDNVE